MFPELLEIEVTQKNIDEGQQTRACFCPVALALKDKYPDFLPSVGPFTIGLRSGNYYQHYRPNSFSELDLRQFTGLFDCLGKRSVKPQTFGFRKYGEPEFDDPNEQNGIIGT